MAAVYSNYRVSVDSKDDHGRKEVKRIIVGSVGSNMLWSLSSLSSISTSD